MATFTDNTGQWATCSDADAREKMADFASKFDGVVTLTSATTGTYGIRWTGNVNGRIFDMAQSTADTSDYAHDVQHDTYGSMSERQIDDIYS